jgi:hypothetical protein
MPRRTVSFAKINRGAEVTLADRGSFHDTLLEAMGEGPARVRLP